MRNDGIIRKIDNLGRIVIPKDIREELNIECKKEVKITIENNKIIINRIEKNIRLQQEQEKQ